MRRAAKIDENQPEIVDELRAAGAFVQSLAAIGSGCPDLLVAYGGKTVLMEIKRDKKAKLTDDQIKWHAAWKGGPLAIVTDVEGALRVLGVMEA